MVAEGPVDSTRVARLARLSLLQREDLALVIGDAAIELWLRGACLDDLVERCLEAVFPEPDAGDSPVRVPVAG